MSHAGYHTRTISRFRRKKQRLVRLLAGRSVNSASGSYFVPTTGYYSVQVTLPYISPGATGTGPPPSPAIILYSSVSAALIQCYLGVVTDGGSWSFVAQGCATLCGTFYLAQITTINIYYMSNGLGITLTFGGPGSVWSMQQIG